MGRQLPRSGQSRLRPRARLISLIGEELISDEPVAVVELVKNAYDADATRVEVAFSGKNAADPDTLRIADNGVGMSLETVLEGWLEPGTVTKRRAERSPGGRPYQGAKGIGRFAAARLAESLWMETRQRGAATGVRVLLDWGRFHDESYLDEIEVHYDVVPVEELEHLRDSESGTSLTLVNLHARKHWSEDDFRDLHTRLSRLMSPFSKDDGTEEISDFEIGLSIPPSPALTGKVEAHELTRNPRYRLSGRLSDTGSFTGMLQIGGRRAQTYESRLLAGKGETVACGPFEVEIRAWDRDRPGLVPYMRQYDLGLAAVRRILNEHGGVAIYRDGFRVHPYGEKGDDWLSLDTRSRQTPTLRLARDQIVAAIRVARDKNPDLKDRSTREGLVHNQAYSGLVVWFTRILALLEEERYRVRPREETRPEEMSTLFEAFDMSQVVEETGKQLGATHPVTRLVKEKDAEIRTGARHLQEHYSRVLMAAGLGQLVDIVIHEIGAPLGRLTREIAYLEKQFLASLGNPALEKLLGKGAPARLEETFAKTKGWVEQISNLRERLVPKAAGRRGRRTAFGVEDEIRDNLALYENLLKGQRIEVTVRAPKESLTVHMSRSDLGQIVANLLDNSVYWLTREHGTGKGGRIDILVTTLKHGFRIRFSDDGPGVAEEDRERIFEAEFSRKANGMGLGLFIARQLIEPYGKLVYREEGRLPGACFEATFEQGVGV